MTSTPLHPVPIVILAPARTYTSVVTAMIGQHPECFAFPELQAFAGWSLAGLVNPEPISEWTRFRRSGPLRAVAYLHDGRDDEEAVERARSWLAARSDWSALDLFEYLLESVSPCRGVEKSPETAETDALARALQAYPDAQFVHLIRHPTATVLSMEAHWRWHPYWRQAGSAADRGPLRRACVSAWLSCHRQIVRMTRTLGPDQIRRLRTEEVLQAPRREMTELAHWLRIRHDTAAVEPMLHPEESPFARGGPESAPGGGDVKFYKCPALRAPSKPGPVVKPEGWDVEPELWAEVRTVAAAFGY